MLGPGNRMARDEIDPGRHTGPEVADHRLLDRADIGQHRALLGSRSDHTPDLPIGGERGGDHHEIGTGGRFGWIVGRFVGEFEPPHRRQGLRAAGAGNNRRARVVAAQGAIGGIRITLRLQVLPDGQLKEIRLVSLSEDPELIALPRAGGI